MTASDIFQFEGLDYKERQDLVFKLAKTVCNQDQIIIDSFKEKRDTFYNIYLLGSSSIWVCAHYDTVNDFNANDNTSSVINCLLLKQKRPDLNIAILDGEEPPIFGAGSRRLSSLVNNGERKCSFILNLELTGYGAQIRSGARQDTSFGKRLVDELGAIQEDFPFSDTDIFEENGIESEVIILSDDIENVYHCHKPGDKYSLIKPEDMEALVEKLSTFL